VIISFRRTAPWT